LSSPRNLVLVHQHRHGDADVAAREKRLLQLGGLFPGRGGGDGQPAVVDPALQINASAAPVAVGSITGT